MLKTVQLSGGIFTCMSGSKEYVAPRSCGMSDYVWMSPMSTVIMNHQSLWVSQSGKTNWTPIL